MGFFSFLKMYANPLSIYITSTLHQEQLIYLKQLQYILWLLRLYYVVVCLIEGENKTLFFTGRRTAAGKLSGIRVLAGCQVVWLAVQAGCHVSDWLWWLWMICMGRRKRKPPSTLWSSNWTQHLVISAPFHPPTTGGYVCVDVLPVRPTEAVCIFWFGFFLDWGSEKNSWLREKIYLVLLFCSVSI